MAWKRTGACPPEQCQGRCCTFIGAFLTDPEQVAFLKTRGVPVIDAAPPGGGRVAGYAMVPQRCQHLTDDNRCGIYDDRPEICRVFPTTRQSLIGLEDHCGFSFVNTEEESYATP